MAFPLGTWAERDGVLLNIDGIAQAIRRNPSAGPPDLLPLVEILEEILLERDSAYVVLGREGILARLAEVVDGLKDAGLPQGAVAEATVGGEA